ncbi:hypothetical protein PI124_g9838 [Phytophthora idaei]|nr:hypothetical protein PI125_g9480 [Phytophthora idaei]KAG3155056.1 hypothetical protein PI126_g9343 [Phytophthora idaei]KAG3245421.1 hypothetical protein PI124_g9838 [Phytophthora idaei]
MAKRNWRRKFKSCEDGDDGTAKLQMPRQMRQRLDTACCTYMRPETAAASGSMATPSMLDEASAIRQKPVVARGD